MVDQIGKEVQDIAREVSLLASGDKTEHGPGICAFVQVPGDTTNTWRRNWGAMPNRLCTSKSGEPYHDFVIVSCSSGIG